MLVLFGWREGKAWGGHLASCMIMSCLSNKFKLGGGTWMEIILNAYKTMATDPNTTDIPQVYAPEWVKLSHEVESVFDGSKDYSKGALYWANLAEPITNEWFKLRILGDLETHKKVCDLNSLTFFR